MMTSEERNEAIDRIYEIGSLFSEWPFLEEVIKHIYDQENSLPHNSFR